MSDSSQPGAAPPPRHLTPRMSAPGQIDLSPLTRAATVLIALDFDGVIAPLQDDPATSAPLPASARAVEELAALPRTPVGYISGRSLEVLKDLSHAPGRALFIGSHGLETDFAALGTDAAGPAKGSEPASEPDGTRTAADGADPNGTASAGRPRFSAPLTAQEEHSLRELDAALEDIRSRTPVDGSGELRVERKPMGRTAHTRGMSRERVEYFAAELAALIARMPQLRSFSGHDMTEFAVRMETKGDGLERMISATRADAVLFMGDDVTDEDAFDRLQRGGVPSVAIKVGEADTLAPLRIAGPEDVAAVLARLARERTAAQS